MNSFLMTHVFYLKLEKLLALDKIALSQWFSTTLAKGKRVEGGECDIGESNLITKIATAKIITVKFSIKANVENWSATSEILTRDTLPLLTHK